MKIAPFSPRKRSPRTALAVLVMSTACVTTTTRFFLPSPANPTYTARQAEEALSQYVRIVVCLILGLSVLRVGSQTGVKRWDGASWHANSYVTEPAARQSVVAWSQYGADRFPAAVRAGRTLGVQFHPEKSGAPGLRLLANFLAEART